ncbi:hypothetical protein ABPG72_000349 [Tetrahymena utriculariae]
MLRLISSLSRQQQNLIVLKGKKLEKVAALFASKQDAEEEEDEEVKKSVRSKKIKKDDEGEVDEDLEKSDLNEDGDDHADSKRRGTKKTFVRETYTKQIRTSQEGFEDYKPIPIGVKVEDSVEYYNKQLENLEKHMPLNIFSCLNLTEQQEKAMRYLLQDDEQRNIRGKISSYFKKIQESGVNEEIVQSIEELVQAANYKEQTFFIHEKDLKTLIFTKELLKVVPQFYNKKYFQVNQNVLMQQDVVQIFKKCKQDPDFYPLFELLKYHKNFFVKNSNFTQKFTSADKEIVSQLIYDIRAEQNTKLNYLLVFFAAHNLIRLNISSQLEAGEISKHFSRIHFGHLNEKSKQDFSSRLHELLNLKIKLGISTSLQHYLCDNFFSFENYDLALSSISYHILILARLAENHTNLNDLFQQYIQTFSQHKFDYYIKENLPQILQILQNKTYYNNLQEALKLFNNNNKQNSHSNASPYQKIDFQRLTYFDSAFAVKNGVICFNYDLVNQTENIPYRYEFGNVLNVEKQSFSNNKLSQFQDTYLTNQREAIVENLLKQSIFNSDIAIATKKKQKELEDLKKTNPNAYYNQMFSFIYNSLDEAYKNEEPSVRSYFKSRNINIPSNSTFTASKYSFSTSSENKKVDDLQDDTDQLNTQAQVQTEAKQSKAFSDFMAKVREIDRAAEKSNPFVTKEDIMKMKNLQSDESQAQANQTVNPVQEAKKEVKDAPTIFTKGQNQQFFADFFGNIFNLDEGVLRLEKELYDQRSTFDSIINGLTVMPKDFVHEYPEGKYLLYKAFTTPQLYKKHSNLENLISKEDFSDNRTQINLKTLRLGDLQRDYKQYLEETVFGKALEYIGYNSLLEVCSVHYKRKFFKKILTHMITYRAKLDKTTLDLIVKICREQKLGLTLFEFTYLLVNNPNSKITQQQFIQLLNNIKTFEEVHEDIETLVRVYLSANINRKFENKILESYINSLIRIKNINKLMSMLERFRDFFLARKITYDEKLSSEANTQISDKFKQEQRDIIQSLFRLYMQKLTSTGLNHYARPLFNELTIMKYSLNEQDYIQGFKSMDDNPEDIVQLYDQLIEQKVEFGVELIKCLLEVFKKHPKPLSQLTIRILNEQIYNDKINIDVQEVNDFAALFTRNETPSDYSDLLKYLLKNPTKVNDYTKLTSYRIVNSISEEMLKSFMKGQVETLFSSQKQEQIRQQLLQDKIKKRNTKRPMEMTTQQQQINQKPQKQQQTKSTEQKSTETQSTADASPAEEGVKGKGMKGTKTNEIKEQQQQQQQQEQKVETLSEEEIAEKIIESLTNVKIIEKDSKRKVLKKTGVHKFKDIDNYIKDTRSSRDKK